MHLLSPIYKRASIGGAVEGGEEEGGGPDRAGVGGHRSRGRTRGRRRRLVLIPIFMHRHLTSLRWPRRRPGTVRRWIELSKKRQRNSAMFTRQDGRVRGVRVLRTKREEREGRPREREGEGGRRSSRRNELQRFSMRITSSLLLSGSLVWLAWDCDSHSNFEKAFISPSLPACACLSN